MFEYRLSVLPPPAPLPSDAAATFFWHSKNSTPYFRANVGPLLGEYGPVKNRNIDFVRIAAAVLAADRSASRSGRLSSWNQRDIALTIEPKIGFREHSVRPCRFIPDGDVRCDLTIHEPS